MPEYKILFRWLLKNLLWLRKRDKIFEMYTLRLLTMSIQSTKEYILAKIIMENGKDGRLPGFVLQITSMPLIFDFPSAGGMAPAKGGLTIFL